MKNLITILAILLSINAGYGQFITTFQPSGGLNDGNDSGTVTTGKDTWVNRYSPTMNNGADSLALTSPRSNCNTSDYKSYFQFDITNLPNIVDSVFFGVTHLEHTSYCFSNCNADFYFYYNTSAWNEMTMIYSNEPSENPTAFCGPINVTFPNNFGNKEYNITNAYNYWKTNGVDNFGFTAYSPTLGCNNASVGFYVYSSDATNPADRPYLKIYHSFSNTINETNANDQLIVSPNPFTDELKINIKNPDEYYFTDITGRSFTVPFDKNNSSFNTNSLKTGLYILHVRKDNQHLTIKVMKGVH